MFSKTETMQSTSACCHNIARLKEELGTADAVVIGAGSGLSASAGFAYTGERFQKYFGDFIAEYGFPAAFIPFRAWRNTGPGGAGRSW